MCIVEAREPLENMFGCRKMNSIFLLIIIATSFVFGESDSDYSYEDSSDEGPGEYVSAPLNFNDYEKALNEHEIVFVKFFKKE